MGCINNDVKKTSTTANNNIDSISIVSNLLVNDSLNVNLLTKRAQLYISKGKIDPALRDLQVALELAPSNSKLFILLSDVYFVMGQTDNSIASLKKALRLNPDKVTPYLKLAETYLLINKPDITLKYADEAIRINNKSAEAYYMKAMGLLESNDTIKAILNFRISANLDSSNYMTYMQLGAIYTVKGDTLSHIYFVKALEAKPNDERALYFLGMYYQEHSNFNKAIEEFTKLTQYYPENKLAYYNMGYIYLVEFQDFEKAKTMFQQAVSISPGYVQATYNLGRTYEAMGNYAEARKQYKKSLKLLPNYSLAVQGMNRLDNMLR